MSEPRLIPGGRAVDDRGEVVFTNDFAFPGVKRFYLIGNHLVGLVRAWHAHRNEEKYVMAISGAAVVGAVRIDDWEHPSKEAKVHRFVLSAAKPEILYVPGGYANGFMTLTPDAKLLFFSTATVEESFADDVRFDARYWDPWQVIER